MKASGFVLAWVAVQARGQGAPSAAVCLSSESAREGSQPSSSPSALRTSRSMIWVATSEPTRCVFAMLGVHGCAVAILDARSCVFAILELTCVMLGVHGCVMAMRAGSCTKAISVCIRNI